MSRYKPIYVYVSPRTLFLCVNRLLFLFLSYDIRNTFSAQITATPDAVSATVTASWILDEGDPQNFVVQLIADSNNDQTLEDYSSVSNAQPSSTGTVILTVASMGYVLGFSMVIQADHTVLAYTGYKWRRHLIPRRCEYDDRIVRIFI